MHWRGGVVIEREEERTKRKGKESDTGVRNTSEGTEFRCDLGRCGSRNSAVESGQKRIFWGLNLKENSIMIHLNKISRGKKAYAYRLKLLTPSMVSSYQFKGWIILSATFYDALSISLVVRAQRGADVWQRAAARSASAVIICSGLTKPPGQLRCSSITVL
ncbi:hypothetical protein EVAR_92380_1 [Eumeta japonica]|uniref:Uncharacterized protein n=1 Tax=Eumeta variegata TaxID=151549 RepID=A0A4C1TLB0_EUMVA|nr:hypothetical protein EVAR_92380_1 [Eumeta japonica]